MTVLWWTWVLSAAAMITIALVAGRSVTGQHLGILIDSRGRCSLSRFQIVWWSVIILSLICGVVAGRFTTSGSDILGFTIPSKVLGLLGITVATTVAATGVKAYKDAHRSRNVAASDWFGGSLGQILTVEEGDGADQTLDVGKFQSLIVTLMLGAAYVLTTIHAFLGRSGQPPISSPAQITTLPDLNATFLTLLAISSAGYVTGKLVNRDGVPALSLSAKDELERQRLTADRAANQPMDVKSIVVRRSQEARARRVGQAGQAPAAPVATGDGSAVSRASESIGTA